MEVQSVWQVNETSQRKTIQQEKELQKVIRESPTKEKPKESLEILEEENHKRSNLAKQRSTPQKDEN